MAWRVGRFVRGMIDEDVQGIEAVAVFDPDRIAAALAELAARDEPLWPDPDTRSQP